MISCFHFAQEEYKPAPKKRASTDSAASKNKRKSSKAVSDTSSSSEEDQVEENVRQSPCVGHFLYKILRFELQVFTELISFLSFFSFLFYLLETKIIANTSSFNY